MATSPLQRLIAHSPRDLHNRLPDGSRILDTVYQGLREQVSFFFGGGAPGGGSSYN